MPLRFGNAPVADDFPFPAAGKQVELAVEAKDHAVDVVGRCRAVRGEVGVCPAQVEIVLLVAEYVLVAEAVVDRILDKRALIRRQERIVDAKHQVSAVRWYAEVSSRAKGAAIIFRLGHEVGALGVCVPAFPEQADIRRNVEMADEVRVPPLGLGQQVRSVANIVEAVAAAGEEAEVVGPPRINPRDLRNQVAVGIEE